MPFSFSSGIDRSSPSEVFLGKAVKHMKELKHMKEIYRLIYGKKSLTV